MCIFYHASNLKFEQGQIYSIDDFDGDTTYDHYRRPDGEKLINIQLDEARPDGVVSRIKCIYLFGNLKHCQIYAQKGNIAHIYRISTYDQVNGPYPMTLTTTLMKCNEGKREKIIKEYWNQTQKWKVFEYFTSSVTIVDEIQFENKKLYMSGFDDYIMDRELSHRLYDL